MILLLSLLLSLQDPAQDLIRILVGRLRSDRIEEREQASRELQKLGKAALTAVEPLVSDPDPEVARRAKLIVNAQARLRLEETLTRAKTVRIWFSTGTDDGEKGITGEIWVKGAKIRAWTQGKTGELVYLRITSDGSRMRVERCTVAPVDGDTPGGAARDALVGIVRAGVQSTLKGLSQRQPAPPEVADEPQGLHHRLDGCVHEVTLNSVSGLPSGRKIRGEGRDTVTEKYVIALDVDLPDEAFAIPGK